MTLVWRCTEHFHNTHPDVICFTCGDIFCKSWHSFRGSYIRMSCCDSFLKKYPFRFVRMILQKGKFTDDKTTSFKSPGKNFFVHKCWFFDLHYMLMLRSLSLWWLSWHFLVVWMLLAVHLHPLSFWTSSNNPSCFSAVIFIQMNSGRWNMAAVGHQTVEFERKTLWGSNRTAT